MHLGGRGPSGEARGTAQPQGPQPMAQPPRPLFSAAHAAFPIAATASGHCRRGLPGAAVRQAVLTAARWLLPCSRERGRPPQALFPQPPRSGPRGLRGGGCSRLPPNTPLLFVLFLALRCLAGFVCLLGGVYYFFFIRLFFKLLLLFSSYLKTKTGKFASPPPQSLWQPFHGTYVGTGERGGHAGLGAGAAPLTLTGTAGRSQG